jgi:hypothetical protein
MGRGLRKRSRGICLSHFRFDDLQSLLELIALSKTGWLSTCKTKQLQLHIIMMLLNLDIKFLIMHNRTKEDQKIESQYVGGKIVLAV